MRLESPYTLLSGTAVAPSCPGSDDYCASFSGGTSDSTVHLLCRHPTGKMAEKSKDLILAPRATSEPVSLVTAHRTSRSVPGPRRRSLETGTAAILSNANSPNCIIFSAEMGDRRPDGQPGMSHRVQSVSGHGEAAAPVNLTRLARIPEAENASVFLENVSSTPPGRTAVPACRKLSVA